jgi:hypothetical protein
MLNTINQIRQAFGLEPVDSLVEGDNNREIVQNTLSFGSNLSFSAGTNFIDVSGNFSSGSIEKITNGYLKEIVYPGVVWTDGEGVSFWTPETIGEFLGRGD